MRNNLIFILICFAVFLSAVALGLYLPYRAGEDTAQPHNNAENEVSESFTPLEIPEDIASAFSRDFTHMAAATKPMRLPEGAFVDLDGKERRFADFKGRPVLVNFWATWCAPCVVELPALEKLANYYKDRMDVVAVALEVGKTPDDIRVFLEKRMVGDFAGYLDINGKMMAEAGIRGLPTSFLIGESGHILYRFEGDTDWTSEESRAFFDAVFLHKD